MSNTSSYHQLRPDSRYALKNKSTGDWFSHVDYSPPLDDPANNVFFTEQEIDETQRNRNKIAGDGKEGNWYKHENNRNYRDPIRCRLPSAQGRKIKEQHENSFSRIGHKEVHQAFIRGGVMREQVEKNSNKIRGAHDIPLWFVHPENVSSETDNFVDNSEVIAVKTRLTSDEAFYYRDRNKLGNNNIFGENNEDESEIDPIEANWRPETRTGLHPRAESDLWFQHEEFDPQRNSPQDLMQSFSHTARDKIERSRGAEMMKILQQVPGVGDPLKTLILRKKSFHEQATSSSMQYVLDQNSNGDYKEPIKCPRAVRPEGQQTFKKNKDGSMVQCLGGYPDKAHKKDVHKTASLSKDLLERQKGVNMAKAIVGDLPPTGRIAAPRVIKPEAEKNAIKNQGSMKDIFTSSTNNLNHTNPFPNGLKLRSNEAKEIARRYQHGSLKSLLF